MRARSRYLPTPAQEKLLVAALESDERAVNAAREWLDEIPEIDGASLQLVPLLYRNLTDLGVDDATRAPLKKAYQRSWLQSQRLLHHLPGALRLLENEGIPTLVHKGAAIGAHFYGDPAVRPMADLDVLVPTRQAEAAVDALLGAGWSASTDPHRALEKVWHSLNFIGPQSVELDLHWNLLIDSQGDSADDDFWSAAVPLEVAGARTLTLCPTDHLLQTLAHGVAYMEAATIRWIADAVTIVRHGPIDWDRLLEQAERRRLVMILRDQLGYIARRFTVDLPTDLISRADDLRTTPLERLEFAEKRRGFNLFALYWRYARRYSHRSWLRNVCEFPSYLSEHFQTRSPLRLVKRVTSRLGERYRMQR